MKSIGEGYTEEEIKKRISEKPERRADDIEPPPIRKGVNDTFTPALTEKPKTIKPLIDIAGNPIYAESRGLEQWARLQNLKNTAAAFNLMMSYGGMTEFLKLITDCKADIATVENGIEANKERIQQLEWMRNDIATYNRTLPIYREYEGIKIQFFKDRFLKKNEVEISDHEIAKRALKGFKRPLRKVSDINAEIMKIRAANEGNNKNYLTQKKAELKQLGVVHDYLHFLKREHEPPPPPREQTRTRKRSYDLDR
jgi:hypothetical protein